MELKTYFGQDASGNIMPGAAVTVYLANTLTLATGLEDENGSPLSNPFSADSSAKVAFYAPDGLYDITVVGNGRTVTIRAQFVSVDGASVLRGDLAAPGGSALVGFQQAGTGAVATTVQSKLRESVSVKDFGAVGDGVTDDTAAIQAALDYAAELTWTGFQGRSFNRAVNVTAPPGWYVTGTLRMKPGVILRGDGSQSTRLIHTGGSEPCILTGKYHVPSDRGPIEDKHSGGVKGLTIYGKKDPTFDVGTIAGRVGKTHLTTFGIDADGATNNFTMEDLLVVYCHNGIRLDRCYTAIFNRVEVDSCSEDGIVIYGGNLTRIRDSRSSANSRYGIRMDRQGLGTGETGKCMKMDCIDLEYNLYDGLYAQNVRQLELDTVYSERNGQITDDPGYTGRISYMTFGASAGVPKGNISLHNCLFNSTSATADDFDLLHITHCTHAEIVGSRFSSNNTDLPGNSSFIRLGAGAGHITTEGNNLPLIKCVVAVSVDPGSTAVITSRERSSPQRNLVANGDLSVWQQATSQSVVGLASADRIEVFRVGAAVISFARQTFVANQSEVPGYPKYYARHTITGSSTSWGFRAYCGQINDFQKGIKMAASLWLRAGKATTVKLKTRRSYAGSGFVDAQSITFALGTSWTNLSAAFEFLADALGDPTPAGSLVYVEVEFGSSLDDSYYDVAAIQCDFGSTPTTIARTSPADTLVRCQEFLSVLPAAVRFSGDVTSGRTYEQHIDWPVPMAEVPTVTVSSVTGSNVNTGGVTVTEVNQYGCTLSVPANGTGYGKCACQVQAKTAV